MRERSVKVLHVINGLHMGGAEMMLYKLLSQMDRSSFHTKVICLIDIGPMGDRIRALGVPVRSLGMRRGVPNPIALLRLSDWLRHDPPDLIQTWLYHADLIGGLAAKLADGTPVAWGIRYSTFDSEKPKRMSVWTVKACARLSRWLPARIVCCSEASYQVHREIGYASEKMVVIPNGFDLAVFKPDPAARLSVRQELGISLNAPLVGFVARFDPQKDHKRFVLAAAKLHARLPECHFLLCGDGITWENSDLIDWISTPSLRDRFHLLGRRHDIPRLTAALDIATTSSAYGEAFPNVIGEAMSCGVPCVVTNVGDSALIVGDTGVVVPPRDAEALADGWRRLLLEMNQEERGQLGLAARHRIKLKYNLTDIAVQYENLYESLAA